MQHTHKVNDRDPYFEIDAVTRKIVNKSSSKVSVIQYDHNSERFTFSLPRYIEDHDMTESTKAEVHYICGKTQTQGIYEMTDLAIDPEDENKVICTWLLSQNVTMETGAINFLVRFSCIGEDGSLDYAWNTAIFTGISVAEGIYNAEAIVQQYADVLEQWKEQLFEINADGVENVHEAVLSAWKEINVAGEDFARTVTESTEAIAAAKNEAVDAIRITGGAYFANALKSTASGEVIRVDDVSPVEHQAKVKVHGKNLFDYSKIVSTNVYQKFTIAVEAGKTYTASSNIPQAEAAEVYFNGDYTSENGVWAGQSKSFVATSNEMHIAFQDRGNVQAVIDGTYYIQLEEGNTATEYEPYIEPSSVTVTRCGKNMNAYPYFETSKTTNGLTITDNGDGTVKINGTATTTTHFSMHPNYDGQRVAIKSGTYTLSLSKTSQSGLNMHMIIGTSDGTSEASYQCSDAVSFTLDSDAYYWLFLTIDEGTTLNNVTVSPQLEKGAEINSFEPYKGETFTPSADGTVDVSSVSPTMTLFSDTEGAVIEVEYSQDTNTILKGIEAALLEIEAIADSLIGGDAE